MSIRNFKRMVFSGGMALEYTKDANKPPTVHDVTPATATMCEDTAFAAEHKIPIILKKVTHA